MLRLRSLAAPAVLAVASLVAGCCADGKCIKDPPCRPCENPCCLTPIQKKSLEASTHALTSGPVVYSFNEKTYVLFTEKGRTEFEKDPGSYEEKGAIRVIKGGKTWRVDINPGDEFDWVAMKSVTPIPYSKPPATAP